MSLLFACACQAPPPNPAALASVIDARHRAAQAHFEAEQARVRAEAAAQRVRDFGPDGALELRDVALIGWPGSAYLKVWFTYVHTGTPTRKHPEVTLAAAVPEEGTLITATKVLILPLLIELGRGSTYTSSIEIPVDDIYERPGWGWDIRVQRGAERTRGAPQR